MEDTEYSITSYSKKGRAKTSFYGKGGVLDFQNKSLLVLESIIRINTSTLYTLPAIRKTENGVGRITVTHNNIVGLDESHSTTFDLFNGIISDVKSSSEGVVRDEIKMKDLNFGKRFINGKLLIISERRNYSYRLCVFSDHLLSGISIDLRVLSSGVDIGEKYTSIKPSFYQGGVSTEPILTSTIQEINSYQIKIGTSNEDRISITGDNISENISGIISHPYYLFFDPDGEQQPPPSLNLFQQFLLGNSFYTENTDVINDLRINNFITKASPSLFLVLKRAALFFCRKGVL